MSEPRRRTNKRVHRAVATLYQIVDLDTFEVLYIGVTGRSLEERFAEHAAAPPWQPYIRAMFGRRIGIEAIREVPWAARLQAEQGAIKAALAAGHPLVNRVVLSPVCSSCGQKIPAKYREHSA